MTNKENEGGQTISNREINKDNSRTRAKKQIILLFILVWCGCIDISASASHARIDSIIIENARITRRNTILRELPFREGEIVLSSHLPTLIEEAEVNLRNISLFNIIEIKTTTPDTNNNIKVNIYVEERWYIWPVVDIRFEDRNISSWLKEGDPSRITFNLGGRIENLLGLNNTLSLSATVGFEKGFKAGFSNIALDTRGRQLVDTYIRASYNHTENANSENNEPNYVKIQDRYLSKSYATGGSFTQRVNVRTKHIAYIDIEYKEIDDTLLTINPNYWGGNKLRRLNTSLGYRFMYDQRNYNRYPTKGYSVAASFKTFFTSDLDIYYTQITSDLQYYHHIYKHWYAANRVRVGTSFKNKDAYILDHAIGYNDVNLRGYEYYVADGQHYAVSNNSLSFNILPKKIVTLDCLRKLPQFHKIHFDIFGRINFDMGYAHHNRPQPLNTLSNRFLYSGGAGIDIVTSYDIVISVDYAINREGKSGVFLQIKAPFM